MIALIHATGLLVGRAVARGLNLLALVLDTLVEARRAQNRFEAERLRGRYHLSSKNDGDFPIVR
jgi:hypothetical protein